MESGLDLGLRLDSLWWELVLAINSTQPPLSSGLDLGLRSLWWELVLAIFCSTQPLIMVNDSSKYDSSKDETEGTRARRVLGA